ncbi:hypothetical protein C8R44DRAFT_745662 [Mycena epipterygia]|nr:hypothetical protein C8R44DRAFT_745662 [Mycena epipterygia]
MNRQQHLNTSITEFPAQAGQDRHWRREPEDRNRIQTQEIECVCEQIGHPGEHSEKDPGKTQDPARTSTERTRGTRNHVDERTPVKMVNQSDRGELTVVQVVEGKKRPFGAGDGASNTYTRAGFSSPPFVAGSDVAAVLSPLIQSQVLRSSVPDLPPMLPAGPPVHRSSSARRPPGVHPQCDVYAPCRPTRWSTLDRRSPALCGMAHLSLPHNPALIFLLSSPIIEYNNITLVWRRSNEPVTTLQVSQHPLDVSSAMSRPFAASAEDLSSARLLHESLRDLGCTSPLLLREPNPPGVPCRAAFFGRNLPPRVLRDYCARHVSQNLQGRPLRASLHSTVRVAKLHSRPGTQRKGAEYTRPLEKMSPLQDKCCANPLKQTLATKY